MCNWNSLQFRKTMSMFWYNRLARRGQKITEATVEQMPQQRRGFVRFLGLAGYTGLYG